MTGSLGTELRKGARLYVRRPLACAVSIHWAAPYTTGHDGVVPAGETLEVNFDLAADSALVSLVPLRYAELEPWLAGDGPRAQRKYQGYNLMAKRPAVEAACVAAGEDDPPPRTCDTPERFRSAGGTVVTGTGVIASGRRFFHEGISAPAIELRRGNARMAGWLLVGGLLLATALVGLPMIVAAVVLFLYKRHEVVLGYGEGERVAIERFADRADAQALLDAITAARPHADD